MALRNLLQRNDELVDFVPSCKKVDGNKLVCDMTAKLKSTGAPIKGRVVFDLDRKPAQILDTGQTPEILIRKAKQHIEEFQL